MSNTVCKFTLVKDDEEEGIAELWFEIGEFRFITHTGYVSQIGKESITVEAVNGVESCVILECDGLKLIFNVTGDWGTIRSIYPLTDDNKAQFITFLSEVDQFVEKIDRPVKK